MTALLALLMLVVATQPGQAAEPLPDPALRALVRSAITQSIRPGFAAMADAASALEARTTALCAAPTPQALAETRAAFADMVRAWSAVEYVRLGPMTEDHRADRLYFWPDRKGITLRHVQRDLAAENPALLTPAGMAEASIAVQGLPALEFLLHGAGAEDLAPKNPTGENSTGSPSGYRCAFAAAIAANVSRIAAAASAEWQDEAGFSALLLSPGPDNPLFRSPEEAAVRITDIPGTGLHAWRDQKFLPVIGGGPQDARPNLAPFRRSGLTNLALRANLEGLKALADASGMAAALRDRAPALQQAIDTVYGNTFAAFDSLAAPLGESAADASLRGPVNYLALLSDRLRGLLQDQMQAALGMAVMFNAYDGD